MLTNATGSSPTQSQPTYPQLNTSKIPIQIPTNQQQNKSKHFSQCQILTKGRSNLNGICIKECKSNSAINESTTGLELKLRQISIKDDSNSAENVSIPPIRAKTDKALPPNPNSTKVETLADYKETIDCIFEEVNKGLSEHLPKFIHSKLFISRSKARVEDYHLYLAQCDYSLPQGAELTAEFWSESANQAYANKHSAKPTDEPAEPTYKELLQQQLDIEQQHSIFTTDSPIHTSPKPSGPSTKTTKTQLMTYYLSLWGNLYTTNRPDPVPWSSQDYREKLKEYRQSNSQQPKSTVIIPEYVTKTNDETESIDKLTNKIHEFREKFNIKEDKEETATENSNKYLQPLSSSSASQHQGLVQNLKSATARLWSWLSGAPQQHVNKRSVNSDTIISTTAEASKSDGQNIEETDPNRGRRHVGLHHMYPSHKMLPVKVVNQRRALLEKAKTMRDLEKIKAILEALADDDPTIKAEADKALRAALRSGVSVHALKELLTHHQLPEHAEKLLHLYFPESKNHSDKKHATLLNQCSPESLLALIEMASPEMQVTEMIKGIENAIVNLIKDKSMTEQQQISFRTQYLAAFKVRMAGLTPYDAFLLGASTSLSGGPPASALLIKNMQDVRDRRTMSSLTVSEIEGLELGAKMWQAGMMAVPGGAEAQMVAGGTLELLQAIRAGQKDICAYAAQAVGIGMGLHSAGARFAGHPVEGDAEVDTDASSSKKITKEHDASPENEALPELKKLLESIEKNNRGEMSKDELQAVADKAVHAQRTQILVDLEKTVELALPTTDSEPLTIEKADGECFVEVKDEDGTSNFWYLYQIPNSHQLYHLETIDGARKSQDVFVEQSSGALKCLKLKKGDSVDELLRKFPENVRREVKEGLVSLKTIVKEIQILGNESPAELISKISHELVAKGFTLGQSVSVTVERSFGTQQISVATVIIHGQPIVVDLNPQLYSVEIKPPLLAELNDWKQGFSSKFPAKIISFEESLPHPIDEEELVKIRCRRSGDECAQPQQHQQPPKKRKQNPKTAAKDTKKQKTVEVKSFLLSDYEKNELRGNAYFLALKAAMDSRANLIAADALLQEKRKEVKNCRDEINKIGNTNPAQRQVLVDLEKQLILERQQLTKGLARLFAAEEVRGLVVPKLTLSERKAHELKARQLEEAERKIKEAEAQLPNLIAALKQARVESVQILNKLMNLRTALQRREENFAKDNNPYNRSLVLQSKNEVAKVQAQYAQAQEELFEAQAQYDAEMAARDAFPITIILERYEKIEWLVQQDRQAPDVQQPPDSQQHLDVQQAPDVQQPVVDISKSLLQVEMEQIINSVSAEQREATEKFLVRLGDIADDYIERTGYGISGKPAELHELIGTNDLPAGKGITIQLKSIDSSGQEVFIYHTASTVSWQGKELVVDASTAKLIPNVDSSLMIMERAKWLQWIKDSTASVQVLAFDKISLTEAEAIAMPWDTGEITAYEPLPESDMSPAIAATLPDELQSIVNFQIGIPLPDGYWDGFKNELTLDQFTMMFFELVRSDLTSVGKLRNAKNKIDRVNLLSFKELQCRMRQKAAALVLIEKESIENEIKLSKLDSTESNEAKQLDRANRLLRIRTTQTLKEAYVLAYRKYRESLSRDLSLLDDNEINVLIEQSENAINQANRQTPKNVDLNFAKRLSITIRIAYHFNINISKLTIGTTLKGIKEVDLADKVNKEITRIMQVKNGKKFTDDELISIIESNNQPKGFYYYKADLSHNRYREYYLMLKIDILSLLVEENKKNPDTEKLKKIIVCITTSTKRLASYAAKYLVAAEILGTDAENVYLPGLTLKKVKYIMQFYKFVLRKAINSFNKARNDFDQHLASTKYSEAQVETRLEQYLLSTNYKHLKGAIRDILLADEFKDLELLSSPPSYTRELYSSVIPDTHVIALSHIPLNVLQQYHPDIKDTPVQQKPDTIVEAVDVDLDTTAPETDPELDALFASLTQNPVNQDEAKILQSILDKILQEDTNIDIPKDDSSDADSMPDIDDLDALLNQQLESFDSELKRLDNSPSDPANVDQSDPKKAVDTNLETAIEIGASGSNTKKDDGAAGKQKTRRVGRKGHRKSAGVRQEAGVEQLGSDLAERRRKQRKKVLDRQEAERVERERQQQLQQEQNAARRLRMIERERLKAQQEREKAVGVDTQVGASRLAVPQHQNPQVQNKGRTEDEVFSDLQEQGMREELERIREEKLKFGQEERLD